MRAAIFILLAIVLIMAGLGAGKTALQGIREKEIMTSGRRISSFVRKENAPGYFWSAVSYNIVMAVGLSGGGVALIVSALRGGRKPPSSP
jgi:hypothetical protein